MTAGCVSSQTSLASAKCSNCRAPTSIKTSSVASSQPASKHSWTATTNAESTMANVVVMTGMMGAIHHIRDLLMQAIASSPPSKSSPPRSTAPTSASGTGTIQDYTVLTARLINNDEALPLHVCSFITVEIINNESLCKMYANMSELTMWCAVAVQFYKNKHPNADIVMQDGMVVGGSSNPYNVFE